MELPANLGKFRAFGHFSPSVDAKGIPQRNSRSRREAAPANPNGLGHRSDRDHGPSPIWAQPMEFLRIIPMDQLHSFQMKLEEPGSFPAFSHSGFPHVLAPG